MPLVFVRPRRGARKQEDVVGAVGERAPVFVAGDHPFVPVYLAVDVDLTVVVNIGLKPDPLTCHHLAFDLLRDAYFEPVPGEGESRGAALLNVPVLFTR